MSMSAVATEFSSDLRRLIGKLPMFRQKVNEGTKAVVAYTPTKDRGFTGLKRTSWPMTPQVAKAADPAHPWGVVWTGRVDTRTCKVDVGEIKKAFGTWKDFSLWDDELYQNLRQGGFTNGQLPWLPNEPGKEATLTEEGKLHKLIFGAMKQPGQPSVHELELKLKTQQAELEDLKLKLKTQQAELEKKL